MLLVEALNDALKSVPNETNGLLDKIRTQEWNEARKKQAIRLVLQLKVATVSKSEFLRVNFTTLHFALTKSECENISEQRDVREISQYVEDIIKDLNMLTKKILFEFGEFDLTDDDIWKWDIDWYI